MKKALFILFLSGIGIYYYCTTTQDKDLVSDEHTVARDILKPKKEFIDISRIIASESESKQKRSRVVIPKSQPLKKRGQNSKVVTDIDLDKIVFPKNQDFLKLDSFYVVPIEELSGNDYTVIEKRRAYAIVQSDFPVGDESLAVVAVKGSKHLGIVTGILKVHLKDFSLKDDVLAGFQYDIAQEYEHIARLLYKLDGFNQAVNAYNKLKKDDDVFSAELEILQFERSER